VFLDICPLFINWISTNPNNKNSKFHLPIMLGASLFFGGKKSSKGNIIFLKEEILSQIYFFLIYIRKNHKLIFQEIIATIIITTNYTFEANSKNISLEHFKIV
jgi:hypothetical protein